MPETAKLIVALVSKLSASVAVIVPIAVWFSSVLKVALEVITGDSSSTSVIFKVIAWSVALEPSAAESTTVTVHVYVFFVS